MKNNTLKKLEVWFKEQFSGLVTAFQEGKLTEQDLEHYLETAPNSFEVLEQYKKNQERNKHIEEYKKIVNNDIPIAEQLKEQAMNNIKLLTEEFEMTSKDQALEPAKALTKFNKLRKLEKKIEEANITIDVLDQMSEQLAPPKRKPGRPKKGENTNEK